MSKYSGTAVEANISASQAYDKLANVEALQGLLDQAPEEIRSKMGDVKFTNDEIVIGTPQIGNITLKVVERVAPSLIKYQAMGAPVALIMSIVITPNGDESCKAATEIDIDVPAMLKPLIGPKMQEAADKFGDLLGLILRN